MLARVLITASATIILALGLLHLVYTFWGPKLTPRDPALKTAMQSGALVITQETTVWKTWIGFNASHSFGGILFGLIYGYLALIHPAFLFQSRFLLVGGLGLLAGYLFLGKRYWFSVPFRGIVVASLCYAAGLIVYFGAETA